MMVCQVYCLAMTIRLAIDGLIGGMRRSIVMASHIHVMVVEVLQHAAKVPGSGEYSISIMHCCSHQEWVEYQEARQSFKS